MSNLVLPNESSVVEFFTGDFSALGLAGMPTDTDLDQLSRNEQNALRMRAVAHAKKLKLMLAEASNRYDKNGLCSVPGSVRDDMRRSIKWYNELDQVVQRALGRSRDAATKERIAMTAASRADRCSVFVDICKDMLDREPTLNQELWRHIWEMVDAKING